MTHSYKIESNPHTPMKTKSRCICERQVNRDQTLGLIRSQLTPGEGTRKGWKHFGPHKQMTKRDVSYIYPPSSSTIFTNRASYCPSTYEIVFAVRTITTPSLLPKYIRVLFTVRSLVNIIDAFSKSVLVSDLSVKWHILSKLRYMFRMCWPQNNTS